MEQVTTRGEAAARKDRLKAALIIRLNSFGGVVWEPPRSPNGGPHINYLIGGEYFGFYVSGYPEGKGNDITDTERDFIKRTTEQGAKVAIIANIDSIEVFMNLNVRTLEIRKAMPRSKMVTLLKEWGAGKARSVQIEREIIALKPDYRTVIYGVFIDKLTMNEIAEQSETPIRTIYNRYKRAMVILADRLVSCGTYMEGLGGCKCSRRK